MAKIKKDDLVQVISGKDKGKQGKVLRVFPTDERVLVEGVNRVTKHLRAGQDNNGSTEGGLQVVEAPIHISNVAVVDPEVAAKSISVLVDAGIDAWEMGTIGALTDDAAAAGLDFVQGAKGVDGGAVLMRGQYAA